MARWTWAVVGLLIGAVLGLLAANGGGYQATATLQFTTGSDSAEASLRLGTTLEALATSDPVLDIAVATLRSDGTDAEWFREYGGTLPAQGENRNEAAAKAHLRKDLTALYAEDTDLVEITFTHPDAALAQIQANTVAAAVRTRLQDTAIARDKELDAQLKRLIGTRTGSILNPVDQAYVQAVAQRLGEAKSALAFEQMQSVQVIRAPQAYPAGPSQVVSGLLGAAGGAFLGTLAAVAAGAGRRRPHSPRELLSLAPDLVVRTTVQAGELAGRAMDTDRHCVVVLAMPQTRFAATQLGMTIAHHLRTHGATVALVDRVSESSLAAASEDRLWALRRDVRRNIPAHFSADHLVVVCGADEEALSLIAGQSDLLVALVAKQRRSVLADIRRAADAVRISEPVIVLAR